MSRYDKRLLPAWLLMAAIVSASSWVLLNLRPVPSPGPAGQPLAIAVNRTPCQSDGDPRTDSGTRCMAHQRYQAAIEAYKKAPTDEAAVSGTRRASPTS